MNISIDGCQTPLNVELLKECAVKRRNGQIRWKYYVAVGTNDGRVGLGVRFGKHKPKTFRKAISNAKKNMIHISKACFENEDTGAMHTISRPTIARYGSLRIEMDPAPRGTGIANPLARVLFRVVGIEDCVIRLSMNDCLIGTVAMAIFHTLKTLKVKRRRRTVLVNAALES